MWLQCKQTVFIDGVLQKKVLKTVEVLQAFLYIPLSSRLKMNVAIDYQAVSWPGEACSLTASSQRK